MKNKVFEINVDFETKSAVDTDLIKIVKGDYNSIEFDLKMDKTDYKRAVLFLVKPSKKNFVVDIANSKAIFTEKNTFDEVGIYYYGIVLYGTNSKLTTSTKGKIQVVDGYNEDNEDITGDENYPILDTLIEEVTDLKDKINASLGVMNKTFKEVTYDASTGVMSFKNLNNEVTNINLPLSLLISSASYDNDNKKIVLTLANNDTIDIPVLDLVSNYYDDKINANKEYIASTSNELYRLKTDVLETGDSSGNNIHLEDSALSEMQEISVDGVCEQETTTGKNLLNYVSNLKSSNFGLTSVINDDGSITTTGKPTSNYSTITKQIDITDILEDGSTYTISQSVPANLFIQINIKKTDDTQIYLNSNKGSFSFVVDKTIYVRYILVIQTTSMTTWGDSSLTITNKYMLCKGTDTADTSFEPYTGGQPSPSPNFPQKIKTLTGDIKLTSCRKNLLKLINGDYSSNGINANVENGIVTLNGTPSNGTSLLKISNFNYVFKANTTYSLNVNPSYFIESAEARLRLANNNGSNVVKDFYFTSRENKVSFSFSENTKVTELWIRTGTSITYNDLVLKPQLNFGQPTSFEPYQDSSLNITIPSNEFVGKIDDTYKDTLNVVYKNDGHYHLILNKMIGKVVLDGEANYVTSIDLRNGNHTVCNYVNSNIKILESEYKIIANKLIGTTISKTWNGNILYSIAQSINGHYIQLCLPSTFTTLEQINNWLKDNPTIVYYFLETPYEVDLGIVDQLLTFDEITNIFTDSDLYPVIKVKYYRNFITTIQNLQVNNDTLKNELLNIESRLAALESANTSVVDNNPTEESEVTE